MDCLDKKSFIFMAQQNILHWQNGIISCPSLHWHLCTWPLLASPQSQPLHVLTVSKGDFNLFWWHFAILLSLLGWRKMCRMSNCRAREIREKQMQLCADQLKDLKRFYSKFSFKNLPFLPASTHSDQIPAHICLMSYGVALFPCHFLRHHNFLLN